MPSSSQKQHNFMEAVAHSAKFAKQAGVPVSVGQDFAAADKKSKKFAGGGPVQGPLTQSRNLLTQTNILPGYADSAPSFRDAAPTVYGALAGLAGTPPDQLEGSVLEPGYDARQQGAAMTFPIGTALQMLPGLKGLATAMAAEKLVPSGSLAAQRGVIKMPGGQWLNGSVEDAPRGLRKSENLDDPERAKALNQFIDKQLTRYIKKDMATPGDPIRAMAEQGIVHAPLPAQPYGPGVNAVAARKAAGFPEQGMATSPEAQTWESLSDKISRPYPASGYVDNLSLVNPKSGSPEFLNNPWLATIDPNTPIHAFDRGQRPSNLGFDHLIDELRNAADTNSGLPAHLQLDPASLARVSVPQAVQRVADINQWRSAQQIAANAKIANNAATQTVKEYPEGYKWVQLKAPDTLPEGWKQKANGDFIMPDGKITSTGPSERSLQQALKYEGDTMGHCVGGYCDDVASGKSNIFSLRDAKTGEPHVTIETQPYGSHNDDIMFAELTDKLGRQPTKDELAEAMSVAPQRILQIKGKGNRAPVDTYLPFVQDFVKSGNWGQVGDLGNTGLMIHPDTGQYFTHADAENLAARHFGEGAVNSPAGEGAVPYYRRVSRMDPSMLSDADKNFVADFKAGNFDTLAPTDPTQQYAQGGSVQDPITARLHHIVFNKPIDQIGPEDHDFINSLIQKGQN